MGSGETPAAAARGSHLIVDIVDEVARNDPSRPFAYLPKSSDPQDGWEPVSYREAANGINYIAHQLVRENGRPPADTFPVIAYIGPNDVRYILFLVGAFKAGYTALFISPRNTDDVQLHLFQETKCHLVWHPSSHTKVVQPWLKRRDMSATVIPDTTTLTHTPVPHFPYQKTVKEAEWDPLVILHTSGSTGFPKPVVSRVGLWAQLEGLSDLPELHGTRFLCSVWGELSNRTFVPFPMFHAAGLWVFVIMTFYNGKACAFPIADQPMTAELVRKSIVSSGSDSAAMPPWVLEEVGRSEEGIRVLQKLAWAAFGGGALPAETGDRLAERGVMLSNVIGSSECVHTPLPHPVSCVVFTYANNRRSVL
jgi:acyl-CoA synthetase (AMP-forming)/AMP-acid ligase II